MIHSKILIPIQPPKQPLKKKEFSDNYFFNAPIYEFYMLENFTIVKNNQHHWFLLAQFQCEDLNELKLTRQIQRPHYLKDETLPALDLINRLALTIDDRMQFDKAFGHALYYEKNLTDISLQKQLKIANYDGLDDPQVSAAVHFIENIFNGEKTHFIAGVETYSFATVTENQYYANEIWPNQVGDLYLLLFAHYKQYNTCPSHQMMPKLLCNLWRSTESLQNAFNHNLLQISKF